METPKQDWQLYDQKRRAAHIAWLRALTPESALALYEEFHALAASAQAHQSDHGAMEEQRRKEKLALRRKMRAAFGRSSIAKSSTY